MSKTENSMNEKQQQAWTTWEELLLTCAVKRYGLDDWTTIAAELQSRVAFSGTLTAQICRTKFDDLRRRFTPENDVADGDNSDDGVPWLEELRSLRIAELKRKVDGHDLSIQDLKTKTKRLEEEKEQSMRENLDLERSENDKNDVAGVSVSVERSEREYRSVNESNSTENQQTGEKVEERELKPTGRFGAGSMKPDPKSKPVGTDSWNDSSKKVDDQSAELRDSAAGEAKESSEVQSSASLTKSSGGGGDSGEEPVVSPATMRRDLLKKSEPLVRFLDMIRSHKHGSMFKIRLQSQKTDEYKRIIRQHVDLETVQTRIENGSYSSCPTKFYLDLLLLVNNAIVFFPKASAESAAAFVLRDLVLKEVKKKRIGRQSDPSPECAPTLLKPKPDPERPVSLLSKHKSSVPIIVCRKRSSISGKPSSAIKAEKKEDEKPVVNPKPPVKSSSNEEESSVKLKLKEKPVTGVRSMRRSGNSNSRTNSTTITSSKNPVINSSSNSGPTNKAEVSKVEKKKSEVPNNLKKRGAADFLKRIKKTSPAKGNLLETLKSSPENSGGSSKRESRDLPKKKMDSKKEVITARQKGSGGKQVKEEDSPSKKTVGRPPKRGKEAALLKRGRVVGGSGDEEVAPKRPKKRPRK